MPPRPIGTPEPWRPIGAMPPGNGGGPPQWGGGGGLENLRALMEMYPQFGGGMY